MSEEDEWCLFIVDDKGDLLNPMGTVERNPNMDSSAGLLIHFASFRPHPLYYPPLEKVNKASPFLQWLADISAPEYKRAFFFFSSFSLFCLISCFVSFLVDWNKRWEGSCHERGGKKQKVFCFPFKWGCIIYKMAFHICCDLAQNLKLKEIVDNKNHTEFFEDEKELLWKLRGEVRAKYPESLSKLLLITKWNKHEEVAQVLQSLVRFAILEFIYIFFKYTKNRVLNIQYLKFCIISRPLFKCINMWYWPC